MFTTLSFTYRRTQHTPTITVVWRGIMMLSPILVAPILYFFLSFLFFHSTSFVWFPSLFFLYYPGYRKYKLFSLHSGTWGTWPKGRDSTFANIFWSLILPPILSNSKDWERLRSTATFSVINFERERGKLI